MNNIFVSVIVCTFNGSKNIDSCLNAISKQSYPDYEILVVDDGSTDNTFEVVTQYKVSYIKNEHNQGLAQSRNNGVYAAKGSIIAFTDDDCIPEKDWLKKIVNNYQEDPTIIGVGGKIVPHATDSLLFQYIKANNPLAPLLKNLIVSHNILYKFFLYLKRGFYPTDNITTKTEVYSLIGASMSFQKTYLNKAGLFNSEYRFGGEEEEICKRIGKKFPKKKLVYNPNIITEHKYDRRWSKSIRRNISYGIGNARTYCKDKDQNPVILPFPFIALGTFIISIISISSYSVIATILAIYILYAQWPFRAIKEKNIMYIIFPFIQILFELSINIGFVKGWLYYRKIYTSK